MTLVTLTYFDRTFLAVSDSRISGPNGPLLEKFPKLTSLEYKFSWGHRLDSLTEACSGNLGFAFSGSTLFSLAFANLFSRAISDMHSFKEQPLPSFGAFEKIASYCARSLIDHVRDGNQCFEALIFGFDPNLAEPRVIKTKLGPGESGAQVTVEFILPRVDKIITLGTGARHLPDEMPKPSEVPLQIFVSNVINSQADRNTGGHVQILELNSKKCVFRGTMLDGPSWDDANYSGVDRGALGEVEGYSVGSSEPVQLKPYSAIRSAAMEKELKHRLTNKELPKSNKNVGPIMTFLSVIHKDQAIGVVDENYHVSPSPLISGQYYFSKVCPSCWRNSPSIHSPANGEGFNGKIEGKGQITTSCQFCRKEMRYEPKDFKVETRWK